jgi:hypothetical protein
VGIDGSEQDSRKSSIAEKARFQLATVGEAGAPDFDLPGWTWSGLEML